MSPCLGRARACPRRRRPPDTAAHVVLGRRRGVRARPGRAAERLADGLAAGDLTDVDLHRGRGPARRTTPRSSRGWASSPRRSRSPRSPRPTRTATATATLGWSWPVSEQDWTYTTEATLTLVDEAWAVEWEPAIVEPSLRPGGVLDLSGVTAARGRDPRRRRPAAGDRPAGDPVRDRQVGGAAARAAVTSAPTLAALARHRRGGVRRAGGGGRRAAFVEAIVLPPRGRAGRGRARATSGSRARSRSRTRRRSRRPASSRPRSSAPSASRPPR